MKTKLLSLFMTLIATSALLASNVITYTAAEKLPETTVRLTSYLQTNAFNASITSHTFSNGIGTITFSSEVISIGCGAFHGCSGLTSIIIPSSVTSIGAGAFWDCSGLTSISIPSSVTEIGVDAFVFCEGLTSIVVESGNPKYDSRNNCNAVIETATNTLVVGCMNTAIPSSITSIGKWAFEGCSGLTSVTIPSSVTEIGNSAFRLCDGLISFTCETTIPPTCGSICFENVDHSIPLYVPAASIDVYKVADEWKDFTNIQAIQDITTDLDGVKNAEDKTMHTL